MESVSSKFHEFLGVLEKCGIQGIAKQIRENFDEQSRSRVERHKGRLSPIGGSCGELSAYGPSFVGENATSHLRHKKHLYRRETSHPKYYTTKSPGQDAQDDIVQRQVRQLNIDNLKLSRENRMLQERIHERDNTIREQDATIAEKEAIIEDLENTCQELLASNRNLEMRINLLLSRSRSLLSLNGQEDTDCPHHVLNTKKALPVRTLSGWAGCRACRRKGNTRCKEFRIHTCASIRFFSVTLLIVVVKVTSVLFPYLGVAD